MTILTIQKAVRVALDLAVDEISVRDRQIEELKKRTSKLDDECERLGGELRHAELDRDAERVFRQKAEAALLTHAEPKEPDAVPLDTPVPESLVPIPALMTDAEDVAELNRALGVEVEAVSNLRAELATLKAERAWQDIATLPTHLVEGDGHPRRVVGGYFYSGLWTWARLDYYQNPLAGYWVLDGGGNPTHWSMPLPAPPASSEREPL